MNPAVATLRRFEPADLETLYRIDQECFPRGVAYSRTELREYLSLPGAFCIVAEAASALTGFVIAASDGHRGHIITLDVVENVRRRGLGTELLLAAEMDMALRGAHRISLETATSNVAAVAFWKKHGYRIEAVRKNYYGPQQDAFGMTKSVAAHTNSSRT